MPGASDAYTALAERKGLELRDAAQLGILTPLLEESRTGVLAPAAVGSLADGVDGAVGAITYTRNKTFRFHAAVTEIPESTAFAPRVFCIRKGRVTRDDEFYGFGARHTKVWTESEALSARYVVQTSPHQDPNWMRQLLSPKVIDWLVTEPPEHFSFELAYGVLLGSIEADEPSAGELGKLVDVTAWLARAVRSESTEGA